MIQKFIICALLIAATLAAYWPVRHFDFVRYDDGTYVTEREQVKQGLNFETFAWAITTDATGTWHPLAWWSHMLDVSVFDMDARGHHATSVLLHAAAVVVLFVLLCRLTGAAWPSAFVAGVFALHPQRVESVAWIAERKDVLCVLFSLLTVYAYLTWAQRKTWWRYTLVVLAFVLALLAKPMAVTVPALLLLLDFWPLGRVWELPATLPVRGSEVPGGFNFRTIARLVCEKLPLFALSAADTVITIIVQSRIGSIENLERLTLTARLGNAAVSYVRYLEKLFWPADLVVLYPHPGHWPLITVIGCFALLVVITIICWQYAKSRPYLLFGWLWFVLTLLPVIGVVQTGYQAMADRYSYLPSVGLLLAIALLLREALATQPRWLVGSAAAALVCVLGVLTRLQLPVWSSTEALYTHAVNHSSDNWAMCFLLAGEYERQASQAMSEADRRALLARATPLFKRASEIRHEPRVIFQYSNNLMQLERYPEMIAELRKALEIDPDHVDSLNNLAYFLAILPDPSMRNPIEALNLAQRVVAISDRRDPNHLDTLAVAYAANNRMDEALLAAGEGRDLAKARGMTAEAQALEARRQQLLTPQPPRIGPSQQQR